jgi:hypothetical protein
MVSVLHIGLPLGPPWLTQEDGEKIAARLAGIRHQMEAAGFRYDVLHASPDTGLAEFRERLRAERVDAVLIGGGVAGDPKLASFKREIIGAAREVAPKRRYSNSTMRSKCRFWSDAHSKCSSELLLMRSKFH